jgi:hypothetical protein
MATNEQKWVISLISGILFYIIALPQTYECVTNPIFESLDLPLLRNGSPSTFGVFVHAIVFFLIVRLMMGEKNERR